MGSIGPLMANTFKQGQWVNKQMPDIRLCDELLGMKS